ncbi:hypothetical protein OG21DRAFT_1560577 [Imleria badia]|nr:hypothetical protein OG21DRAFT_1560577 [Imleria badia]
MVLPDSANLHRLTACRTRRARESVTVRSNRVFVGYVALEASSIAEAKRARREPADPERKIQNSRRCRRARRPIFGAVAKGRKGTKRLEKGPAGLSTGQVHSIAEHIAPIQVGFRAATEVRLLFPVSKLLASTVKKMFRLVTRVCILARIPDRRVSGVPDHDEQWTMKAIGSMSRSSESARKIVTYCNIWLEPPAAITPSLMDSATK